MFYRTGKITPVAVMKGKLNGQYIIEGLVGGFLYSACSMGILLLNWSIKTVGMIRMLYFLGGSIIVCVSYSMIMAFLRMKGF